MLSTLLVTQQEVILYHMRQLAMSGDKGRMCPNVYSTQSIPATKKSIAETLIWNPAYGMHLVKV